MFENPQPASSKIVQAVDSLKLAIEGRLKSKSRLALTIDFPSHIFRYLFEGKGEVSGGWLYPDEKAFDRRYYPQNWDECLDSFGEGHKICYPVRMRILLFWSPKRFIKVKNGELYPCSIMATRSAFPFHSPDPLVKDLFKELFYLLFYDSMCLIQ